MDAAALVVGINYESDPANRLAGCSNDAWEMAAFLSGLGVQSVCVCTDERDATAERLRDALGALVRRTWLEDRRRPLRTLIVHFSGHGVQVAAAAGPALEAIEPDGLDEAIVCPGPAPGAAPELLRDDELARILRGAHPDARIFAVMDACHSGSVLDLPHVYDGADGADGAYEPPSAAAAAAAAAGPRIVCLSGCRDAQVSMDAYDAGAGRMQGAMTAALLRVLSRQAAPLPAFELQAAVRAELRAGGFDQRPVLSASCALTAADLWMRLCP